MLAHLKGGQTEGKTLQGPLIVSPAKCRVTRQPPTHLPRTHVKVIVFNREYRGFPVANRNQLLALGSH